MSVLVDERKLADFILLHDGISLKLGGSGGGGDELSGHHLVGTDGGLLGKANVAGGDEADEAVLVVDNREAAEGEVMVFAVLLNVVESIAGVEDDGLYVLRTRVSWGNGGEGYYEELVRLVRKKK